MRERERGEETKEASVLYFVIISRKLFTRPKVVKWARKKNPKCLN
jgi:hypothetical protein